MKRPKTNDRRRKRACTQNSVDLQTPIRRRLGVAFSLYKLQPYHAVQEWSAL